MYAVHNSGSTDTQDTNLTADLQNMNQIFLNPFLFSPFSPPLPQLIFYLLIQTILILFEILHYIQTLLHVNYINHLKVFLRIIHIIIQISR